MFGKATKIICGIAVFALLCGCLCSCGGTGNTKTLEDFLQKFEKSGYQMTFDDGSIADIEEDLYVSGMIATYAEYSGERFENVGGSTISDSLDFYYIKCIDEEKAAIVFDALVEDQSMEEGVFETKGSNREKTTYDYYYSWEGYEGLFNSSPAGFSEGREIVSRYGSVVVYVNMNYTDHVKADAAYHFAAEDVLEKLGF